MKTNKTLIIIIAVLVILLGISIFMPNKENNTALPLTENTNATTTASTTAPIIKNTKTVKAVKTATTSSITVSTDTLPKQFILSVSDSYSLPDGSIMTLKDVLDSRCPTDANINCAWAGNVVAKVNIKKGSISKDFDLTYPGQAYIYDAYKIAIFDAKPDKGLQSVVISKKDYKIIFVISN